MAKKIEILYLGNKYLTVIPKHSSKLKSKLHLNMSGFDLATRSFGNECNMGKKEPSSIRDIYNGRNSRNCNKIRMNRNIHGLMKLYLMV